MKKLTKLQTVQAATITTLQVVARPVIIASARVSAVTSSTYSDVAVKMTMKKWDKDNTRLCPVCDTAPSKTCEYHREMYKVENFFNIYRPHEVNDFIAKAAYLHPLWVAEVARLAPEIVEPEIKQPSSEDVEKFIADIFGIAKATNKG